MRVICAWCASEGSNSVTEKEPMDDDRATHSICPSHRDQLMRDFDIAMRTQTPAEVDLGQRIVQVPRTAIVRAVRSLSEIEGLALLRSAYNLSLPQARIARAVVLSDATAAEAI